MVPGDYFGMRTLLPNDELAKRVSLDKEDMKKGSVLSLISRKSTIRKFI